MKKLSYEEITKATMLRIEHLAACANAKSKDSAETRAHHNQLLREWAYGAYMLWEMLTTGMWSRKWEKDSSLLKLMAAAIGRCPDRSDCLNDAGDESDELPF